MKITFAKDRETKNAWRFKEETEEGAQHVVGFLYVQKSALEAVGAKDRVAITLEAA